MINLLDRDAIVLSQELSAGREAGVRLVSWKLGLGLFGALQDRHTVLVDAETGTVVAVYVVDLAERMFGFDFRSDGSSTDLGVDEIQSRFSDGQCTVVQ